MKGSPCLRTMRNSLKAWVALSKASIRLAAGRDFSIVFGKALILWDCELTGQE